MSITVAIILGLVQGLTEFFPVSSSGHLVLLGLVLGHHTDEITFDILVHLATLVAIIVYFRKDCIAAVKQLAGRDQEGIPKKLWLLLFLATLPAAVTGLWLKDTVSTLHQHGAWVGFLLMVTGCVLLGGLCRSAPGKPYAHMTLGIAMAMGLAQVLAILPGMSRSGWTIMAGVFLGMERTASARFSFLMAIPVIGGAGLLAAKDLLERVSQAASIPWAAYGAGALAALGAGLFALWFMMRLLEGRRFFWFGIYCLVVGLAAIIGMA